MTKRIPKLSAPEEVHQKLKSATLTDFCEVYIPMAPDVYTYGVPAGVSLLRGDVVWVQFATRKKPALAIVSKVHQDRPSFDVRPAYPHQSGYRFSERYMEMLEWTARYYISTPMKALFVFWPSDFEKYLDALAFTKGEASPSREPQGSPATPSAGSRPATPPNAPSLTLEQTNAFNTLCEELDKDKEKPTGEKPNKRVLHSKWLTPEQHRLAELERYEKAEAKKKRLEEEKLHPELKAEHSKQYRTERGKPFHKEGDKKPFKKDGDHKPFRKDGDKKPFKKDGEAKTFRKDGDRKPFRKDGDKKPYGGKNEKRPRRGESYPERKKRQCGCKNCHKRGCYPTYSITYMGCLIIREVEELPPWQR